MISNAAKPSGGNGAPTAGIRAAGPGGDAAPARVRFLGLPFDLVDWDAAVSLVASPPSGLRFGYVVTPNVDHVVKASQNESVKPLYDAAWLSLCDSKPILMMSNILKAGLSRVTGSDLTAHIFREVVRPGDKVTLVVANREIADRMAAAFPQLEFRAHVPPMGVMQDPASFQSCVDFVAGQEARFIFLGIGAPQSETIAHALSRHPSARGIALCTGASFEFMLGLKPRAPQWMQSLGLEWLHRLATEPRRLWRRYLLAFVPLAGLFISELRRRRSPGNEP